MCVCVFFFFLIWKVRDEEVEGVARVEEKRWVREWV